MGLAMAQDANHPAPVLAAESSNGAFELSVVHAKPEPGTTREGQNLRGILTVTLKNISDRDLRLLLTSPECDYSIEIRDSSGSLVKPTELGERLLPKTDAERAVCPVMRATWVDIEPGKEYTERWDVNHLFRLDPREEYTVTLGRAKGLPFFNPSGRRELRRLLTIRRD
jgi:hypothetical protein